MLDLPLDVPDGLSEVLGGVSFQPCAPGVFHGVADPLMPERLPGNPDGVGLLAKSRWGSTGASGMPCGRDDQCCIRSDGFTMRICSTSVRTGVRAATTPIRGASAGVRRGRFRPTFRAFPARCLTDGKARPAGSAVSLRPVLTGAPAYTKALKVACTTAPCQARKRRSMSGTARTRARTPSNMLAIW